MLLGFHFMLLGFKNRGLARNPGPAPRSLNPELSVVGSRGRARAPTRLQAARGTVRARPQPAPGPRTRLVGCGSRSCRPWSGDNEVSRAGAVDSEKKKLSEQQVYPGKPFIVQPMRCVGAFVGRGSAGEVLSKHQK